MDPICEHSTTSIISAVSTHHGPFTHVDNAQLSRHTCEELHHHSIQSLAPRTFTMLRSFPRAAPGSPSIRGPSIRTALRYPRNTLPICTSDAKKQQIRSLAAHAISNPTLSGIEKRWENMPPQEQADLWMALRDRMKNDWHEMTLQERKAGT